MANKREAILSAIASRLGGIAVSNGYATNIGSNVFLWRTDQLDESQGEIPGVIVRDRLSEITDSPYGILSHVLTVEIETVVMSSTTATTARSSAEDILAAIATDDTWGGLADHSEVRSVELAVIRATQILGGASVTLAVIYETDRWAM